MRGDFLVEADQIALMLTLASKLSRTSASPLRPEALRIAVVLLYTSGLRLGELRRLTMGDVVERGAVLRIRESKFHKSRLVPLSKSAAGELQSYGYKEGADVQTSLPKLALYMGHVSIESSAYYLHWVPTLRSLASQRFEQAFGQLVEG